MCASTLANHTARGLPWATARSRCAGAFYSSRYASSVQAQTNKNEINAVGIYILYCSVWWLGSINFNFLRIDLDHDHAYCNTARTQTAVQLGAGHADRLHHCTRRACIPYKARPTKTRGGRGGMDVAELKKTYQLPQSSELMLSVCPIISVPYPRLNRELTTLNCAELRAAVIVFEGME